MTTTNVQYLRISQLDLHNPLPGYGNVSYNVIPAVPSFDEVQSVDCISHITVGVFENEADRNDFAANFPKSYKARLPHGHDRQDNGDIDFDRTLYYVSFSFDLFLSKTTGHANEAMISRRLKVIKKIKSLLNA